MKSVTIQDVARKAKVSVMTVSNVSNAHPHVSEQTRKKVRKAIDELGYYPNESAQRLARKDKDMLDKTDNLGCIIFGAYNKFSHPYYSRILEGIDREVIRQGYHLLFSYTTKDLEDNFLFNKMINQEKIDGLILVGYARKEIFEKLEKKVNPLITVNYSYSKGIDSIVIDRIEAGYRAVKYLLQLGHRAIGFIGGPPGYLQYQGRIDGYKMALAEFEIPYREELIVCKGTGVEAGFSAMEEILNISSPPTAIFAYTDLTALGVMKAIKSKGLSVPEDISVVGFNDDEIAAHLEPPLTTIRAFKEQMGEMAVRKILERIKNREIPPVKVTLPTELVIRESCAKNKSESLKDKTTTEEVDTYSSKS